MKRIAAALTFAGLALTAAIAMAQMNHYDFGPAQQMIDQTLGRIENMRRDGHDQFDGHALKAEELLRQAKAELNAAAEYRARR
ncbi:hypothetical protein [Candidatus Burkholderia verschuerenii]|uniref:hypothetical protein n=1 Tax=Candidatus Burkholderia verschuerenii TaxID=242163 RepID=UPI00067C088A|nr:hypothetical protein [Candidatus Burkholderia verschuerenii]